MIPRSLINLTLAVVSGFWTMTASAANSCDKAMTQADINQCAAAEMQAQDKRLNAAYAAYRRTLDPAAQQELKAVQLAWIRFRDLTCTFEAGGSAGGTVHSLAYGSCLTRYTAQRADDFARMGKCEEGDVSCRR